MKNKIKFCKKCLYSEYHPLGITFNFEGICSGCQIHEEKNNLDWVKRFDKLKKITNRYKIKNKKNYDCIVPVNGNAESYFIVENVKKLGLNPLLVTYNKYFNTPLGIKNLANLRTKFDCDILYQNINPQSVKKITQYSFYEKGNIYWPILAGQSVFPVQTAINYKIPLIIWGAHQGMEQVGMFSHLHEVEMSRRYRHDHDLFGNEADELLKLDNNLTEEDVWQYRYPNNHELEKLGVKGIYLNNYIRWDPLMQNIDMVNKYNFETSKFDRTFDTYDHVDCFNYMNLHDYLKLCKHGYSKVTDHACREIRFNRISRDQGILLIKKYEQKKPHYISQFCEWLGISEKGLYYILNRTKNKMFWKEEDINKWKFEGLSNHLKFNNKKSRRSLTEFNKLFLKTNKLEYDVGSKYITFGKGI
jgi:N-acetyl sugar amidotransferase